MEESLNMLNQKFEQQEDLVSKRIDEIEIHVQRNDTEAGKTKQDVVTKAVEITKQTTAHEHKPYNFLITNNENTGIVNSDIPEEHNNNNKNRLHHNLAQRFKDRESEYAGTDDEDLIEHLSNYETGTDDYGATEDEKLKYIHNILNGEALRLFILK